MAEFPALPFFTDAYLADTRHLTTEEHGVYLLLLMCAWRTRGCSLKDEDKMLARIAGLSLAKWRKMRPAMLEFFSVENGVWRQKKLSQVYETVSKKVERNRANGSKGGKAKAFQQKQQDQSVNTLITHEASVPNASFSSGCRHVVGGAEGAANTPAQEQATKTKFKTKQSSSEGKAASSSSVVPVDVISSVAAAAELAEEKVDHSVVSFWISGGADVQADIVPTIRRIRMREEKRSGKIPLHLAYYSAAILEARDKRVGAKSAGEAHVAAHPAKRPCVPFEHSRLDHWRRFLGDSKSKFRGEYLSSHWCIPPDHPVFLPSGLGPDPCHRANHKIPAEIYEEYGALWGWRPRPKATGVRARSTLLSTSEQEPK